MAPSSTPLTSTSLRILVIDDDDIARETMIDVLRRKGHRTTGLASPIGATKHILQGEIDVVVLDLLMPSIRGDKLAALLRRNPRLRSLGVVLVTGAPASELGELDGGIEPSHIVDKTSVHLQLGDAVARVAQHASSSSRGAWSL